MKKLKTNTMKCPKCNKEFELHVNCAIAVCPSKGCTNIWTLHGGWCYENLGEVKCHI